MANHCWNYASLEGSKEMLDLFESRLVEATKENGHLWYETFFQVLGKEKEEGDVYNFFGTKWFDVSHVRQSDTTLTLEGSSAWAPPLGFYTDLSSVYQLNITSQYDECGCDFGGWFEVTNGEVTLDRSVSYDEFAWETNEDYAIERFIENISDGYYDTIDQITSHFYWDKLTATDKNLAIDTFNQYKS